MAFCNNPENLPQWGLLKPPSVRHNYRRLSFFYFQDGWETRGTVRTEQNTMRVSVRTGLYFSGLSGDYLPTSKTMVL